MSKRAADLDAPAVASRPAKRAKTHRSAARTILCLAQRVDGSWWLGERLVVHVALVFYPGAGPAPLLESVWPGQAPSFVPALGVPPSSLVLSQQRDGTWWCGTQRVTHAVQVFSPAAGPRLQFEPFGLPQ